jgi:hypothetical protein
MSHIYRAAGSTTVAVSVTGKQRSIEAAISPPSFMIVVSFCFSLSMGQYYLRHPVLSICETKAPLLFMMVLFR